MAFRLFGAKPLPGPLRTIFNENLIKIDTFSLKEIHLKNGGRNVWIINLMTVGIISMQWF